jgi:hypothetical protein
VGGQEDRVKIYKYEGYTEYVLAQTAANRRKIANVWVRPETIAQVAKNAPSLVHSILCHGTRNGAEQKLFKHHFPRAFVIGTEISDNTDLFQYTIQHDFHEPRDVWNGLFDIVYSNSLDHSYDPLKALRTWRAQLMPTGRLFIEYCFTPETNIVNEVDSLQISFDELVGLFDDVGVEVLTTFKASGIKGAPSCASTVFVLERA